jgi:hypothetical protein
LVAAQAAKERGRGLHTSRDKLRQSGHTDRFFHFSRQPLWAKLRHVELYTVGSLATVGAKIYLEAGQGKFPIGIRSHCHYTLTVTRFTHIQDMKVVISETF